MLGDPGEDVAVLALRTLMLLVAHHRPSVPRRRLRRHQAALGESRCLTAEMASPRFDEITWREDGLSLGGLAFRYQHGRPADTAHARDEFTFYKLRSMISEYESFFAARTREVRTMLEIGMWDGGSLAFWSELLRPARMIGIDIQTRGDSAYFRRYVEDRGLANRIATHWGVDQGDGVRLASVLEHDRDTLDLVVDDGSHRYEPTRASFETVFPLLQPGGAYIVEDWAWEHWPEFFGRDAQWASERPMADLVHQLVQFAACDTAAASVHVYKSFVVVIRGDRPLPTPFDISSHIRTRPSTPVGRRILAIERGSKRFLARASRRTRRALGTRTPHD